MCRHRVAAACVVELRQPPPGERGASVTFRDAASEGRDHDRENETAADIRDPSRHEAEGAEDLQHDDDEERHR